MVYGKVHINILTWLGFSKINIYLCICKLLLNICYKNRIIYLILFFLDKEIAQNTEESTPPNQGIISVNRIQIRNSAFQ